MDNSLKFVYGKEMAASISEDVRSRVELLGITPKVAVIVATDDPSVLAYANTKKKKASGLGIELEIFQYDRDVLQNQLEEKVVQISNDQSVQGIFLELPLYTHLDTSKIVDCIDPRKDIDGITSSNMGMVLQNRESEAIVSATPQACVELLQSIVTLKGKTITVVGRGQTVGRPLLGMLLNRDATPKVCHTSTLNLADEVSSSDIIIVAAGRPNLISAEHVKEGQIIVDAGINFLDTGKLVGDVDVSSISQMDITLTPVPGGIGPITNAIAFRNVLKAISLQDNHYAF